MGLRLRGPELINSPAVDRKFYTREPGRLQAFHMALLHIIYGGRSTFAGSWQNVMCKRVGSRSVGLRLDDPR